MIALPPVVIHHFRNGVEDKVAKMWERLMHYKTFTNLTFSYISLVIFSVAILSFILFYSFTKVSTDEIGRYSQTMLSQINQSSDDLYDKTTVLSNQIFLDRDVTDIIKTETHSPNDIKVLNYNMFMTLNQIKAIYSFIYSIGIYSFNDQISTDSAGIPLDKEIIRKHANDAYFYYYPRNVNTGKSNVQGLITFVYYTNKSASGTRYAVIINIDQKYILGSLNEADSNRQLMITDSRGTVISNEDSSLFMKNISGQPYYQKIGKSKIQGGNFTATINHKKQLVTFSKSEYLDWNIISISPYSKIIYEIEQLKDKIIGTTAVLILICVFFAILFANMQYKPLKLLVDNIYSKNGEEEKFISKTSKIDEYKILTDAFEKSKDLLNRTTGYAKNTYLLLMLKGLNTSSIDSGLSELNPSLTDSYFCTVIFKVDKLKNTNIDDINLILYAIENVSTEIFRRDFLSECLRTENDEIVFALQFRNEDDYKKVRPAIQFIQKIINDNLDGHFSAGIGNLVSDSAEISKSYRTSEEYIKYRLFYGPDSIMYSDKYKEHLSQSAISPVSIEKYEKKIAGCININNQLSLENSIDHFISSIRTSNYYQAISYCTRIVSSVSIQANCYSSVADEQIQIISHINHAESLAEISQLIKSYCIRLCQIRREMNQRQNELKNHQVIGQVNSYIQEHYSDPDLCLESIADKFTLSPGYLGKLFKSFNNQSFNEYLTGLRLNRAKELLEITDKPILEICKDAGIYNVTYFSTLFKKYFSVTPSAYRETLNKPRL